MTNLADNLTKTAEEHGDRPAVRLDDMVLSYDELLDGARRVAALLADKGVGPGDRVGLVLPNVPRVPGAVLRRAGGRRGRRTDEPAAQGPRGEVLPRGLRRQDRLRLEGHGRGGRQGCRGGRHRVRRGRPGRLRSSCSPSTSRTTRSPTARATTPSCCSTPPAPPASPRAPSSPTHNMITNAAVSAETLVELTEDDVVMGCLPLFHCFGLTCGLNAVGAQGRLPDPDPPLRRGQGARGRRPRQGHRLRGRPDDVRRDAARRGRRRPTTCRACAPASPAAPRCRSR